MPSFRIFVFVFVFFGCQIFFLLFFHSLSTQFVCFIQAKRKFDYNDLVIFNCFPIDDHCIFCCCFCFFCLFISRIVSSFFNKGKFFFFFFVILFFRYCVACWFQANFDHQANNCNEIFFFFCWMVGWFVVFPFHWIRFDRVGKFFFVLVCFVICPKLVIKQLCFRFCCYFVLKTNSVTISSCYFFLLYC